MLSTFPQKFLVGCVLVLVILLVVTHYFGEGDGQKKERPKVEYQPEPKMHAPREDTTEVLYNVHVFFSNGYRVEYKPDGVDRVIVYADSTVSDSTRERLKHTNPFSPNHRAWEALEERPGYGTLEWVVFTRHSRLGLSESIIRIDMRGKDESRYERHIDLPRQWCKVEVFHGKVLFTKVDTLKAGRRSRW